MGKRLQPRLRIDALTGEWRNGEAGEGWGSEPWETRGTPPPGRRCVLEGPPLGPRGEDITWPDQVAPRRRKACSPRKIKPQTSNRAGVFGDAVGGGALGVTQCRGCGGGGRDVVGDGTSARCWWGWWWCG